MGRLLWTPPADVRESTRMGRFVTWVEEGLGRRFDDYQEVWRWTVDEPSAFWSAVWDHFDIPHTGSRDTVLARAQMPFAEWFPDVCLNYAEAMLRLPGRASDDVVIHARSDSRPDSSMTAAQLREQVARVRTGLLDLGVTQGDRVAAYVPNIPEAVVLMLATVSIGAVYTSCPPEFGVTNVVDRWSQIDPTLIVAVDGYVYGGKRISRTDEVAAIASALGKQDRVVLLPYMDPDLDVAAPYLSWATLVSASGHLEFEQVPFDHPLWILFTSGTTGPPKPIVHGHGGITLEFHKLHGLHHDLGPSDTFFWFSTTGWVMWNFLLSSLLVGTTIVLYDGNPGNREMAELWLIAGDFKVSYLGLSAPFVMQCRKNGLAPATLADLSHIREIGSTGSPLPEDGFDWLIEHLGGGIRINSTSGGTDVATAFVGGAPLLPIRAGEISGRQLGCRVEAWDDEGNSLIDQVGEMVVTAPMPSMPVFFWGDESGERYRSAYFDRWPGVWRHGDWITIGADGHCVIHGRSDATLNRGGVRLGTAEFYRVIENLDTVADSMVIHLESDEGDAGELILFLVTAPGVPAEDSVIAQVRGELRQQLSPRHVPDSVYFIDVVPRTLSGKKLEVPAKKVLLGAEPAAVADLGALADPRSLDAFVKFRRPEADRVRTQ
jgi:acetoacetyl-CoA synthetase